MTFEGAIQSLKDGHIVARAVWRGRDCGWQQGRMVLYDGEDISRPDWRPADADRAATDWMVVGKYE